MVEAGRSDVLKGLLVDELRIVFFEHRGRLGRPELSAQRVLIHDALVGFVGIEHAGRDEGFDREPASQIDPSDGHGAIRPVFVQRWHKLIGFAGIIPRRIQSHDGQSTHHFVCIRHIEVRGIIPGERVEYAAFGRCGDIILADAIQIVVGWIAAVRVSSTRSSSVVFSLLFGKDDPHGNQNRQ